MSTFPIARTVSIVPVLDTAAYAAGEVLFTDMVLAKAARADAGIATLISISGHDLGKQSMAFDILFFNSEPATGTYTINGAFTLHDTDAPLFVGHVNIVANDYAAAAASSVFTKRNIGLQMECLTGDDLYVIGVTRNTPDYVAATDMKINFNFILE